jgi:hypothetical protein
MHFQFNHALAQSLEHQRKTRILNGDMVALKKMLSPNMVYIHSTGGVDTFESYFDKLNNRSLVYLELDYENVLGSQFDETLIVTGQMNAKLLLAGQQKSVHSLYMATWIKSSTSQHTESEWVMYAHQGAPRPQ